MTEHICPPDHLHGARATCYGQHRCRCANCREAHRVRCDTRRRLIAYGRWDAFVDASELTGHVRELRRQGMTVREIAEQAAVSDHTVHRAYGGVGKLKTASARALREVRFAKRPLPYSLVDGTGTRRRLQALMYMGWTGKEVLRRAGINPTYIARLLGPGMVQERIREAITGAYLQMWDQEPPQRNGAEQFNVRRARALARSRGFVGPLAWDDDIDDPAATPISSAQSRAEAFVPWEARLDEAVVEAVIAGEKHRLAPLERQEVVRRLWARCWSDGRIAEHIGGSDQQVMRVRRLLGLRAWDMDEMETAA